MLSLAQVNYFIDYYRCFKPHVHALLGDNSLSDTDLEVRARERLQVLDHPSLQMYNKPRWMRDACKPTWEQFSAKRAFEAMYEIADNLGLRGGRRYLSACIISACAMNWGVDPSELESFDPEQTLTLSALVCDIWLARVWGSVFPPLLKGRRGAIISEQTKVQVMGRDGYTSIKSGKVDYDAPRTTAGLRYHLQVVPICNPVLPNDPLLLDWTLDFFIHYLGVDVTSIKADSPSNCLLLDVRSKQAFCDNLWTLAPTETANQYRVVDTTCTVAPEVSGDSKMRRDGDHVTFVDHTGGLDLEPVLPSRDVLLLHAAYTSFLHLSGMRPSPEHFRRSVG
ncbi:hypothetical protein L227DRAFT_574365 [Lentinus tigrinus ALCF2SS1-6]|uniref:HNH nuclease domain-containing protein n=1 Tax=Lentinus tigrinus ALCF2SS1-6 TaxID=1328759 RepID=A0A5C2SBW3_9APHY|nr:hypothetical protein L227DRAFT_574365 [Lentinus tigrinus ALCF2SS1-6]